MADDRHRQQERSVPPRTTGRGQSLIRVVFVLAAAGWLCGGKGLSDPAWADGASDLQRSSGDADGTTGPSGGPASQTAGTSEHEEKEIDPSRLQGPALSVPREIIDMLDQRKRHLDRREASLRGAEERLLILKTELEQIVTKYEQMSAVHKQQEEAVQKRDEERKARRQKEATESRAQHQSQLAKIYESMPPEEAAASLERMPERKAIEVLRILKGKSAGAILAAIRPERAARLTEQLLMPH